ncbi:hypothetical protein HZC34_01855 [Candidatus Saganbacteria bacterium]|nr:hypothetical protein [Candidatus Saganbacteria bacterium]
MALNLTTDFAKEKLYAAQNKQQQKEQFEVKQDQLAKQDPNMSTGLQWATKQTAGTQAVQSQKSTPELMLPSIEDTAMISSSVTTSEKAVTLKSQLGLNMGALEQSFKEIYKKSKSHNMLLERFMANVKLSGITAFMGLVGASAETLDEIKAQVREEALNEIETKLSQDWAYTVAMLDITGSK